MALYIPTYNTNNCVVLMSSDIIRVYERQPYQGGTFNYIDYYYRSNYYSNSGVAQFSQYSSIPTCRTDITTDIYDRYDFDKIIIIFLCLLIIIYFMGIKPIIRLFGRWLKI